MRRIITVICFFIFCVGICTYTILYVDRTNDQIQSLVSDALDAIVEEDEAALKKNVDAIAALWKKEEERIVHYVRHAQIDEITKSVARLKSLEEGGDFTELAAELNSIRWQMEHVHRNEQITFANLLRAPNRSTA